MLKKFQVVLWKKLKNNRKEHSHCELLAAKIQKSPKKTKGGHQKDNHNTELGEEH